MENRDPVMTTIITLVVLGVIGYGIFLFHGTGEANVFSKKRQPVTVEVDSTITPQDVHRDMQEVVTIDLEEHEEPTYFTMEDFKAWWHFITMTIEERRSKRLEEKYEDADRYKFENENQ